MGAGKPWETGDTVDGFRLERRLARGGMADVFVARPIDGGRPVVIKSIREDFVGRNDMLRMFEREATLLSTLDHPNIVRVHKVRLDLWQSYIAMELLEGCDLRDLIKSAIIKNAPLPVEVSLRIIVDVLRGLHHAHDLRASTGASMDLVHRDVSPSNVMITRDGRAKLLDFGIAKTQLATPTSSHLGAKGKGAYMAPEQCRRESVDRRADVYAVGVVLYELLTLKRAFSGDGDMAVLHAILEGDVRPPGELRRDLPEAIEAVVMRALSPEPNDRYSTAEEMAAAVESAAGAVGLELASRDALRAVVADFEPPPSPVPLERSLSALRLEDVNQSLPGPSNLESTDQTKAETSLPPPPHRQRRRGYRRWAAAAVGVTVIVAIGSWVSGPSVSALAPRPGLQIVPTQVEKPVAPTLPAERPLAVDALQASPVPDAEAPEEVSASTRPTRGASSHSGQGNAGPKQPIASQEPSARGFRLDDELRAPAI